MPSLFNFLLLFKRIFILTSKLCRFGHVYHNLQPRVTRTLLHAFLDPTKALPQHYGAIQGLAALGPSVVISYLYAFLISKGGCYMFNWINFLFLN
jgi:hypothetical protein